MNKEQIKDSNDISDEKLLELIKLIKINSKLKLTIRSNTLRVRVIGKGLLLNYCSLYQTSWRDKRGNSESHYFNNFDYFVEAVKGVLNDK